MLVHRILSVLLGYPDAELHTALPEIAATVATADLSTDERAALDAFIIWISHNDPTASEEEYVRTFDLVPEHSLHLTHHLMGEDKNRGPALIDLAEYYKAYGIEIVKKELPDYLPLVLEFTSVLDGEEGRMFLSRWNRVLRQLQANLAAADSPYAPLVGLLEARSRLVEASGELVTPAAGKTDPCLDDGDFDPPVDWSAPPAAGSACTL